MTTALDDILAEERARVRRLEYAACVAQRHAAYVRDMGFHDHQRLQSDAYAVARGATAGWSEAHARLRAAERELAEGRVALVAHGEKAP